MKHKLSEEDKELLRQDKPWLDAFMAEHYSVPEKEKKTRRMKTLWLSIGSCAVAAALILTLVLCVPRLFRPSSDTGTDMQPKKEYALENREWKNSSIELLSQNLQGFFVELSVENQPTVSSCFDSYYDEILFFLVQVNNEQTLENAFLYFYANPDFPCEKTIEGELEKTDIGVFSLAYRWTALEDDGIYSVQYKALTEYSGVTVYIEYSQMSATPEGDFFSFFAQTFQAA